MRYDCDVSGLGAKKLGNIYESYAFLLVSRDQPVILANFLGDVWWADPYRQANQPPPVPLQPEAALTLFPCIGPRVGHGVSPGAKRQMAGSAYWRGQKSWPRKGVASFERSLASVNVTSLAPVVDLIDALPCDVAAMQECRVGAEYRFLPSRAPSEVKPVPWTLHLGAVR